MRRLNADEEEKVRHFTQRGAELAFLEPTANGLKKSIMDATGPLREFLKRTGLHDYESQGQGEANRKLLPSYYVTESGLDPTTASLYRPVTKHGDPRIWFSRMRNYVSAGDILGLLVYESALYVIDLSRLPISDILADNSMPSTQTCRGAN